MSDSGRNRKRKKKKAPLVIFVIEIIALVVLAAGIFLFARLNAGLGGIGSAGTAGTVTTGGGTVTGGASAAATPDPNFDADAAEENSEVASSEKLKGYTNIALVGIDTRDSKEIDYANSDTMIIASINNATGKIRMVSLYRDTLLNIGKNLTYNVKQGDSDDLGDIVDDGGDGGDYDNGGDTGGDVVDDGGDGGDDGGDDGGNYDDGGDDDNGGGSSSDYDNGGDDDNGGGSGYVDNGGRSSSYYDNGGTSSSYYDSGDDENDGSSSVNVDDLYNNNDSFSTSDSAVTKVENYQLGETKAEGNYDKANAAYQNGSAKQLLSMLNKNLDLNIHDYVVVDFNAVAKLVDDLDGIDVWMTKQEVVHMNNYCVETSKATGLSYTSIEPSEEAANYHLNGVQAVSYARIRYTTGNDMKRTQRQRVVINKIVDKAKSRGLTTVNAMINDVFPYCKTSFSAAEIIQMATTLFGGEIEKTTGFPFEHLEKKVVVGTNALDCVVPVTLADNVKELHEFLFDEQDYQVSSTVQLYSEDIQTLSNLTESNRDLAKKNSVIGASGGEADVVK